MKCEEMKKKYYIGIDIGGTKCAAVVGDENGKILERKCFPSGKSVDPQVILNQYLNIVKGFILQYSSDKVSFISIGISCGGPVNSEKGIIMCPPNLPLWNNIEIVKFFNEKVGLPTFLQNDANACALAEWKFGSGIGTKNMIFLTFGTGLGAGLILNGNLYSGTSDMAGEVGHVRLTDTGPEGYNKKGSFEGYCSGNGIVDLASIIIRECWDQKIRVNFCKDIHELETLTAKMIFDFAKNGDPIAKKIVKCCGENLGKGLSILIDILNPECIVIGSIYTRAKDQLEDSMIEYITKEALPQSSVVCRIKPAKLGDQIGDYASLMVAMSNIMTS